MKIPNIDSDSIIDVSDISDIQKTKSPLNDNEYMLITKEGLYFMSIFL